MSQHVSDLIRRRRLLLSYNSPSLTHTLFYSLTSSQTDVNVVIVDFNTIFNTAASFHIAVFITVDFNTIFNTAALIGRWCVTCQTHAALSKMISKHSKQPLFITFFTVSMSHKVDLEVKILEILSRAAFDGDVCYA